MKKKYIDIEKIDTKEAYSEAVQSLETLINEATEKGFLTNPELCNEYTDEISRLGNLCADYESTFMDLKPLKVKSPLILSIENEIKKNELNQRQTAQMLNIKENTFSQIMTGKRNVSMRLAKKLYEKLRIDPKTIIEYA
ncbi:MAG: helix-turn-helix domain-containing protein [Bacteroidales bacterium]|jgi:predicted XRE-type DNA-binding protein|nr:helix-turn-helix domain-containing protein [Bacteroidales bacterium]